MKKFALSVVAAALALTGLTACGHDNVTYQPAAYGEYGHCYYVEDPLEVTALYNSGLCPRSWTPVIMPLYWHAMYYPYYSSPAYYSHYVPVASRTVYVQHSTVFYNSNKSIILTAEKKATYKGSNGKIVKGNKIAPKQFGGGSRTNGGGSRTKTCGMGPINGANFLLKGGGGGSRSGGSGGSRTSTRTNTGTKSKTGGC